MSSDTLCGKKAVYILIKFENAIIQDAKLETFGFACFLGTKEREEPEPPGTKRNEISSSETGV